MGVAVVVGGAGGIGAAVAVAQRAAGDRVVVWDRVAGAEVVCDVRDADQVEAAVAATLGAVGVPDRVTVASGVGHAGMLLDAPAGDFDEVMGTNARGTWLVVRGLAREMLAAEGGSIVVLSSVSARLADASMGLYCASKAAVEALVRVAAVEWAPSVRVNAVAPGVTDTAMLGPAPRDRGWLPAVAARTPAGRLGSPEAVAAAVAAVHDLDWVTGQVLAADGGLGLHSPIDPTGVGHRRPAAP